MENKESHPKAALEQSYSYYADQSAAAQRARLLDALRCCPVSTLEARRNLDILMPAARIHELRHAYGYQIDTVWVWQKTELGRPHRVALYVLLSVNKTMVTSTALEEAP